MHNRTNEIYGQLLENQVAELVLNRPSSCNALSKEMWLAIPQQLKSLQKQGALIVVLRGVGVSFAAGADLVELASLEDREAASQNWDAIASALEFLYRFELPTIAAIDGPCLGGGCLLACACDLRYASQRSTFSVPIAKLGIVLDDANLGRLASLVGVSRAKEMIFRGLRLSAAQAQQIGLVNDVFPVDDFADAIELILSEILTNSSLSLKDAKLSFLRYLALAGDSANHESVINSYLLPDSQDRIQRALKKD